MDILGQITNISVTVIFLLRNITVFNSIFLKECYSIGISRLKMKKFLYLLYEIKIWIQYNNIIFKLTVT